MSGWGTKILHVVWYSQKKGGGERKKMQKERKKKRKERKILSQLYSSQTKQLVYQTDAGTCPKSPGHSGAMMVPIVKILSILW